MQRLLTVTEVALALRAHPVTIRRWSQPGGCLHVALVRVNGRSMRFRPAAIACFMLTGHCELPAGAPAPNRPLVTA